MGTDAFSCDLDDGLVLQVARGAEDLECIAGLHALVFGPTVARATGALIAYPGVRWQDFCWVRDGATGEAVSSICLVPTTWVYEGVPLRVAELGVVATHPDYRRRGLIRHQMRWFEQELQAREFDLASIMGIPFFYRQFGYEYAVPTEGGYELRPEQVPSPLEGEETAPVREAMRDDIPLLQRLLAAAGEGLALSLRRESGAWLYQGDPTRSDDEALVTYLVGDGEEPAGYFRLYRHESQGHPGVRIVEASPLSYRGCVAALRLAREMALTCRQTQSVRVSLPSNAPLAWTAASLGGRAIERYGWLVRIPDPVRFLRRVAPALERRLAASFLAGYNTFLRIDLYTDTLELIFRRGRLAEVRSLGPLESQAVRLPWWAAWQLWLGAHSREELTAWYPDARVDAALQPLVDVLFPKRESWIYPTL